MTHYLAPALATLRAQINAAFSGRDRLSDGWIGDAAHSARKSDHNADWDSTPPGVVRALDVDEDLWGRNARDPGAIAQNLADAILADPRVAYVIYEGRIAVRQAITGHVSWRKYTGVNAHKLHIHVSLRHGRVFEQNTSPWRMPGPVGVIRPGTGANITPAPVERPSEEDDMNKEQNDALAAVYANQARLMQVIEALDVRTGAEGGTLRTAARQIGEVHGRVNFANFSDGKPMRIAVQGDVDSILRAVAGVQSADVDEAAVAQAVVALLPAGATLDPDALARAVLDAAADRLKG